MSEVKSTISALRKRLSSYLCKWVTITSILAANTLPSAHAQSIHHTEEPAQVLQNAADQETAPSELPSPQANALTIPLELPAKAPTYPSAPDSDEVQNIRDSVNRSTEASPITSNTSTPKTPQQLKQEELANVILVVGLFVLVIIPCLPFWILRGLANSETDVAFANDMEIFAYLIGCTSLIAGWLFLLNAQSVVLLSIGVLLISLSLIIFLSLLGFQRQLSRNMFSTLFMFATKIAYFVLTFLVAMTLRLLAMLLAKSSYDKAKNREYAGAGLMLGGAAVSWRAGGKFFSSMSSYVNGVQIPAVAQAFPGDSFFGLIKQGFQGYSNRYAYQKRWKSK